MTDEVELEVLADRLWGAQWDLTMGGVLNFRGRMTVVKLESGELLLHSPIPISDALAKQLSKLGPVRHLVAPSCLHHVHLDRARERYPDATVWGAPGLATKLPRLQLDQVLDDPAAPGWPRELEFVQLEGNKWMGEIVFFHRSSATLLVTDLLFNIHRAQGWFTRLVLRSVGAFGKPAQSLMVRLTTSDKDAFARCFGEVLEFPFVRLVPAHGRVIDQDAHSLLRQKLSWLPRRALAASS